MLHTIRAATPWRFARQWTNGRRAYTAPPHILVGEHDAGLLARIAVAFEGEGYSVAAARSGAEIARYLRLALVGWQGFRVPDLVVFDVDLPDADRAGIVTRLYLADSALPVVLLSGEDADSLPAVAHGAIQFTKPFDIDDLRTVALNLLPTLH